MKFLRWIIAIIMATQISAAVCAQSTTQIFKPAGPWAMEYADEGCRLIRNFSDGSAQLTLAFERFALKPSLRLGLTSAGLRGFRSGSDIEFRYEGQAQLRKERALRSDLADGRAAYMMRRASLVPEAPRSTPVLALSMKEVPDELKAEIESASHVSALTIVKGFDKPVSIELGSMAAPMKAMQSCASDLVSSWGIDVPRLFAQSQPVTPISSPARWIGPNDYPRTSFVLGLSGTVSARLIIEADGSISKCMVDVGRRGEFEKTVCDLLMKRAKFKPAVDAGGKAMRAYWTSTWNFFTL